MRVSDIMSTPVHTIGANEPATAAWEAMRLHRIRHLVVADSDGRVVGVVSTSDLGGRQGERLRARKRVGDLMLEKVVAAQPETTVREAANLMRGHGVNCLLVFDARDHLKGIRHGGRSPGAARPRRHRAPHDPRPARDSQEPGRRAASGNRQERRQARLSLGFHAVRVSI
jgi:Mg/Co/Ni transporter MgtE